MHKDVKKGCLSCTHKDLTMKQEPCKSCKDWSEWEDKDNGKQTARDPVGAASDTAAGVRKAKRG